MERTGRDEQRVGVFPAQQIDGLDSLFDAFVRHQKSEGGDDRTSWKSECAAQRHGVRVGAYNVALRDHAGDGTQAEGLQSDAILLLVDDKCSSPRELVADRPEADCAVALVHLLR